MKLTAARPDVHAALTAVLAHAGGPLDGLDWVGLCDNAHLDAVFYATDKASLGIGSLGVDDAHYQRGDIHIPLKEAKDLARYLKPMKVGHKTDTVTMLLSGDELHVGIADTDGVGTSEVYAAEPAGTADFPAVWRALELLRKEQQPADCFTIQAGLVARFKAAEREYGDRMRVYPALAGSAALVTVGSSFIGAIAALGEPESAPETPYGDCTLEDWGL